MLSRGQWIFAIVFLIFFTIIVMRSYRRDKKLHDRNYKGVKWVLVSFISFIIFLFLVKFFLKN